MSSEVVVDGLRVSDAIRLEIYGKPAPKGSGRAFLRGGRAIMAPSGSDVNRANLRSWDQAVRFAANEAVRGASSPPFVGQPLAVSITFRLARPAGHWGKKGLKPSAPAYHMTKPDKDKLERATLDSLTGIIFDDDSRIVRSVVSKDYADVGNEGATVVIQAMGSDPAPF